MTLFTPHFLEHNAHPGDRIFFFEQALTTRSATARLVWIANIKSSLSLVCWNFQTKKSTIRRSSILRDLKRVKNTENRKGRRVDELAECACMMQSVCCPHSWNKEQWTKKSDCGKLVLMVKLVFSEYHLQRLPMLDLEYFDLEEHHKKSLLPTIPTLDFF